MGMAVYGEGLKNLNPVNLSGKKVFFFAWGENAEDRHINYEFGGSVVIPGFNDVTW